MSERKKSVYFNPNIHGVTVYAEIRYERGVDHIIVLVTQK